MSEKVAWAVLIGTWLFFNVFGMSVAVHENNPGNLWIAIGIGDMGYAGLAAVLVISARRVQ